VLPFAVLTLKAASTLLLGSRLWKSVIASPWRSVFAVLAVALAAWWIASGVGDAQTHGPDAPAPATQAGATHHGTVEGEHAAAEHGTEAEAESGPQKFPNVITLVTAGSPHAPWAHFLHHYEAVIFSLFVGLMLCLLAFFASRNPQMIPGGLQNGAELVVEKLHDFIVSILGPHHG